MLWRVSEWLFFPSPCQSQRGFFSPFHEENLGCCAFGGKTQKCDCPIWLGSPGVFDSGLCTEQFVNYSSDFLPWCWMSAPLNFNSLCSPVCIQFGGSWFVRDLTHLMYLKRIVDFSVCSTLYLFRWTGNFQAALHARTETGNLLYFIIILAALGQYDRYYSYFTNQKLRLRDRASYIICRTRPKWKLEAPWSKNQKYL